MSEQMANKTTLILDEFDKIIEIIRKTQTNTSDLECEYIFNDDRLCLYEDIKKMLENKNYDLFLYKNVLKISWYYD